jgi:hypothetical protein
VVSFCIWPISAAISPAAVLRALGELADFLGDDREASGPARRRGRPRCRVERQQIGLLGDAVMVSTIPADALRALRKPAMASVTPCWRR